MERVVSDRLSYNEGGILGKGASGFVFSGTLDGQIPVAVKRVQLDGGSLPQRKAEAQKREEEAVRQLDHPNVVKILHLDQDLSFRYFAIELCSASLDQCFLKDSDPKKFKGALPAEPSFCYQLVSGLQYIHSKNLLHRNIKPENVLISTSGSVKLSEFGLPKPPPSRASSTSLTQYWMAPEVLKVEQSKRDDLDGSTVQSDTFSLGLVLFAYFTNGQHLFGSMKNLISVNIQSGKAVNLSKLSSDHFAHDIVVSMTKSAPEQRAKLSDVVGKLKPLLPTTEL